MLCKSLASSIMVQCLKSAVLATFSDRKLELSTGSDSGDSFRGRVQTWT